MSYSVIATSAFKKELKRLAKKYNSLKEEFSQLVESLEQKPEQGTSLGNQCYKIRIAIKSKGKTGGARVITYVYVADSTVFLLSVYDKSEQTDITDSELKSLLKNIGQ